MDFTVGRCKHVIRDTKRNNESCQSEPIIAGVGSYVDESDQSSHADSDPNPDSHLPPIFTPPDDDTSNQKHDTTHNRIDTERQPTEGQPTEYQSDSDPTKLFDRIEFSFTHTIHVTRKSEKPWSLWGL